MTNNYLELARQARKENNTEDAKLYYGKLKDEGSNDAEVKFFYAYYSMYEDKNRELPKRFFNLCQILFTSLETAKKSSASEEEQLTIIDDIVSAFIPEPWSMNRYMNSKNRETKVGDSYVKVFQPTEISNVCKDGLKAIRELGDKVTELYPNNNKANAIAVNAWKEYVSLAQKWYAYAPKGDAEKYAEKIKKYEPSYEMPKKAGCISIG